MNDLIYPLINKTTLAKVLLCVVPACGYHCNEQMAANRSLSLPSIIGISPKYPPVSDIKNMEI